MLCIDNELLNLIKGDVMYLNQLKKRSFFTVTMVVFLAALFMLGGCAGKQLAPGTLIVKGKVKQINLEQSAILVAPPKGERVQVFIHENTQLNGYDSIKSIKKNDPVEVLYKEDENKNNAISIRPIPLGSC